jgi:predicted DNA-binding transcriptional regulator YafY
MQSAISEKQIIELQYRNNAGITSLRLIEPIGLTFYAYAWHIIAWCHNRKEYRDFKVVHIQGLKQTGLPFKRENHITLNEYIASLQLDCIP